MKKLIKKYLKRYIKAYLDELEDQEDLDNMEEQPLTLELQL